LRPLTFAGFFSLQTKRRQAQESINKNLFWLCLQKRAAPFAHKANKVRSSGEEEKALKVVNCVQVHASV